jgi:hypothetical protein
VPIPRCEVWVCFRSLSGIAGSNTAGAWISLRCVCCVLSGRGLCDGRSLVQKSPTGCGVSECEREASIMRMPWPAGADAPCSTGLWHILVMVPSQVSGTGLWHTLVMVPSQFSSTDLWQIIVFIKLVAQAYGL